ncbi:MAG: C69 family dipeptidase [Anaerolineaceae bacterium]|nr:C69 family dipeptidase [Anaerolineaceae bacterium]
MCDTLIAQSNATADGSVILAKNSDREPNEAHEVVILPALDQRAGSLLHCTYIEIPQVAHTYAVLLCKPFWMWGAEMGANEYGVVIANEATFTRQRVRRTGVLTGMDLNRLALERAETADKALDVVISLVEQFGQGGNGGYKHPFYYDNSFMIADFRSAWVLDFSGNQWAARQINGTDAISNAITIHHEWERASVHLVDEAVRHGWCQDPLTFDYARNYSDPLYTHFSAAANRRACATRNLEAAKPNITVETFFKALRDHGVHTLSTSGWTPANGITGMDVCAHAGFGPIRKDQSVGSFVAHLTPQGNTFWVTGTSAPCTGVFKPVWLDAGLVLEEPSPQGSTDPRTLWWRHESLHREVIRDYAARLPLFIAERDDLEKRFLRQVVDCSTASLEERRAFSQTAFNEADIATKRWTERVRAQPVRSVMPLYHRYAWNINNKGAHFV